MNVLVLTSEPIAAEQLRDALPGPDFAERTEVLVVAPALHESALRFWLSDADEAIAKAERVSSETVERLGEAGVPASGDTGESDPMEAIEDALRSFAADRIVVFTHPESDQRYREGVCVADIEQRFGLPVDHASVSRSAD